MSFMKLFYVTASCSSLHRTQDGAAKQSPIEPGIASAEKRRLATTSRVVVTISVI